MTAKVVLRFMKRNTGESRAVVRTMEDVPQEGDLVVMNSNDDCGVVEAIVWGLDGVPVVAVVVTPNVTLNVE